MMRRTTARGWGWGAGLLAASMAGPRRRGRRDAHRGARAHAAPLRARRRLQLSTTANRAAAKLRGFQAAAGINLSERLSGAQVGLINIADDVSVPIGILSIVRKGRLAFEATSDDTLPLAVSVKYGSRTVYVLVTEGMRLESDSLRTLTLLGLGVHFPLDVDLSTQFIGVDGAGSLSRMRAMVGWELKRRFAIFAGVSLNSYAPSSEEEDPDPSLLPQWKLGRGPDSTRVWPGLLLGVRI